MRRAPCESLEPRLLFATLTPGFIEATYGGSIGSGTAMEFSPDGRLFVARQTGQLRVVTPGGTQLGASFVDLDVDSSGERGLLGVAFDPAFMTNGYVYLYYTVPNGPDGSSGANNRISRFTAVDADPGAGYLPGNTAVPGSELPLLNLSTLSGATNHNGGAIHFGPDGKLYAAVGENAFRDNAQSFNNHHGKILRLNPDGTAPADNPFNDADATPNEPRDYFWAMGLRNPFTTAFDPATGAFWINDVGEGTWEEINVGAAGANYGWPTHEGPETVNDFATPPIFAYTHAASGTNGGNVIAGGAFYRAGTNTAAFPADYDGDYFFADSGRGWIRRFDQTTGTPAVFATGAGGPVDLKMGPDGALYYLSRGNAAVFRAATDAPRVVDVFVNGTDWTAAFRNFIASTGAGDATRGFRITPAAQADELPWTNVDQVSIRFSENVNVTADDLAVAGVNVAGYAVGAFAYDAATFTATWTLAAAAANDKLLLNLDADGAGGVTDTAGNRLDGEWANPVEPAPGGPDAFPSGNGVANGDFRFRVNLLPGDANRSGGVVNAGDVTQVRNRQFTDTATPGTPPNLYSIFHDVNGNGVINAQDVTLTRNRQFTELPAGDPPGTTLLAPAQLTPAQSRSTSAASAANVPNAVNSAALLPGTRRRLVDDLIV